MLKRASDWTYTRSHLRATYATICAPDLLDILSKSFTLFAKESHVKACFRLDLCGQESTFGKCQMSHTCPGA